jgi:hypothetical protein
MKYLKHYNNFLHESQSKKLRKYLTFSVVLKWYGENKQKIADILGVDVEDLATEDSLLDQSHGLVNHVINTQRDGDGGNDHRTGFSKFDELEKNLIHDILHNIYQAQEKDFTKNINDVEFTESELIEEIECLGIEESFMKYMNIPYPKTDFINQNINFLVGHLMLAILKEDGDRVGRILDGEEEPCVVIYGKKYPVTGTAFEGIYTLFQNTSADRKFNINSSEELKGYLIHLINVGDGIDVTGGDRAEYPDGNYYGDVEYEDVTDETREECYQNVLNDHQHINISEEHDINSLHAQGVYSILRKYLPVAYDEDSEEMADLIDALGVETEEEALEITSEYGEETEAMLDTDQLFDDEGKNDYEVVVTHRGDEYIAFDREGELLDFEYAAREVYETGYVDREYHDKDHEFIVTKYYRDKSISSLMADVISDDNALSILRRNFRKNDIVRNNTKLGKGEKAVRYYYNATDDGDATVKGSKGYEYIDFVGKNDYVSVSKNLFSDNAKNLVRVLDELRGHLIKNIDTIKKQAKVDRAKFTQEDIRAFRQFTINKPVIAEIIDWLEGTDEKSLRFPIYVSHDMVSFYKVGEIKKILNVYPVFGKLNTEEDMLLLFNYVNKGFIKDIATLKEYIEVVKNAYTHIQKYPKLLRLCSQMDAKVTIPHKPDYETANDVESLKAYYNMLFGEYNLELVDWVADDFWIETLKRQPSSSNRVYALSNIKVGFKS